MLSLTMSLWHTFSCYSITYWCHYGLLSLQSKVSSCFCLDRHLNKGWLGSLGSRALWWERVSTRDQMHYHFLFPSFILNTSKEEVLALALVISDCQSDGQTSFNFFSSLFPNSLKCASSLHPCPSPRILTEPRKWRVRFDTAFILLTCDWLSAY